MLPWGGRQLEWRPIFQVLGLGYRVQDTVINKARLSAWQANLPQPIPHRMRAGSSMLAPGLAL